MSNPLHFSDLLWLLFLFVLLYYFWKKRTLLRAAQDWLVAKGSITELSWTDQNGQIWPTISYTFELYDQKIQGEDFFPDRIQYNPNSKHARKIVQRALQAFQNQEEIDIFYNPKNPLQSALDVAIPAKLDFIIGLLLFFVLMHISIIIYRFL